ncbi:MAG: hypothetical protein JNK60_17575 [Acidobacteria bacterium]|nr:hypothetical protein [Acidobacteriota bacterium]
MNRLSRLLAVAVAAATLSGLSLAAVAQTTDVEVGYRFTNTSGNENVERSQGNEREGFLVRGLYLDLSDKTGGFADRFKITAFDVGASPAGMVRLEAGRAGIYAFKASYARRELFSALPGFANALQTTVVPGLHTMDRVRTGIDADLTLLPGGKIQPFVGYSYNRLNGPGETTYTLGQDEFRLAQNLTDTVHEIRGGVNLAFGILSAELMQGYRFQKTDETLSLVPGAGAGNSTGTAFPGTSPNLTAFARTSRTDVDTPITNLTVRARTDRFRFLASFVRARAKSDSAERENATGDLVFLDAFRTARGYQDTIAARATGFAVTGVVRAELTLLPEHLDLSGTFTRRVRRTEDAQVTIEEILIDSLSFSGGTRADLISRLEAGSSIDRATNRYEAQLDGRFGPVSARAAYQLDDEALTFATPLAAAAPGQAGTYDRTVRGGLFSAMFSHSGITVGGEAEIKTADEAVLRTDFRDKRRYRGRAGYRHSLFSVSFTAQETRLENDRQGIGWNMKTQSFSGRLEVTPVKVLSLYGGAALYDGVSDIFIRRPVDFGIETSHNDEEGKSYDGGLAVAVDRFRFDGSFSTYKNEGNFPLKLDRIRVRAEVDLFQGWGIAGEVSRDKYREENLTGADYTSNRYGVFLRYSPK